MAKLKAHSVPPSSGVYGSIRIAILDDDDFRMMRKDLKKYSDANRIGIEGNELWAYENDSYMKNKFR